jgi:hypothetical protein
MMAASKLVLLAVLSSFAVVQLATAKVVRWDLKNVTFEKLEQEQSTASGFFLFDADASPDQRLVSWDITITNFLLPTYRFLPASGFNSGGGSFEPQDDIYCFNSPGCIVLSSRALLELDPVGRTGIDLFLFPQSPLSDAGGHVPLGGYERDTYYGPPDQSIVTGELVAVPEATQVLPLVVGLMSVGCLRLRSFAKTKRLRKMPSPGLLAA